MLRERARSFSWRSAKAANRTAEKNGCKEAQKGRDLREYSGCAALCFLWLSAWWPDGRLYRHLSMEGRTETQRRRPADNYWLNVVQIPMLRALGIAILCVYVLLYDLLIAPPFSLAAYLAFVAILAAYCLVS